MAALSAGEEFEVLNGERPRILRGYFFWLFDNERDIID